MSVRAHKQAEVRRRGVGTDLHNEVITFRRGVTLGAYRLCDGPDENTTTITVAISLSDCDLAIIVMESYVWLADEAPTASVREAFAHGDPRAFEALIYATVPRVGDPVIAVDPYRYEGRNVVFAPVDPHELHIVGEPFIVVARALGAQGYQRQRDRPGPALVQAGSRLTLLGEAPMPTGQLGLVYMLATNCPCGSNKPMSACCGQTN